MIGPYNSESGLIVAHNRSCVLGECRPLLAGLRLSGFWPGKTFAGSEFPQIS